MVEKIIKSEFIWRVKTDSREEEVVSDNIGDFNKKFWKLFNEIQRDRGGKS